MLLHCWPDSPGHCQHAPDKPFSMISATLYALRSNIFCKVTKFTIYLHTFAADNLPPNYIIKVQIKEFQLKYYFRSVEIENVFRTSLRESFTVTTSLLDGWVGTEEQVHHSHSHVWSRVMVTTDSWSLLTTSLYHLIFQCWAQEELPDTHRIPNNAGLREEEFSEACGVSHLWQSRSFHYWRLEVKIVVFKRIPTWRHFAWIFFCICAMIRTLGTWSCGELLTDDCV